MQIGFRFDSVLAFSNEQVRIFYIYLFSYLAIKQFVLSILYLCPELISLPSCKVYLFF